MKEYLLSIIAAALIAATVGILSPAGSGKGIAGHLRLLCSFFLLLILLAPLKSAAEWIRGGYEITTPTTDGEEDFQKEMENAMLSASKTYLAELLLSRLQDEFSIREGEIRCAIQWEAGEGARPKRVSVILSGSAIWRDPESIEAYVESLLGCECVSAIESS